jgi:predicted Zn-dependent peptidase/outer membrane lipoprotein-sorting protein
MKRTALYILLPGLLALSTGSFAQLDRSKIPAGGPAPAIKIGKYETFTLPNGLQVFVVTNRKLPRVAFNLVLDNDPVQEKEFAGYVDIAGQMLRTGTKTRTKEQLDEAIDFIGASLSTSESGIYGASLKKHQDKLLELMSDVILNPSFPESELSRIKRETISGIASQKDDPNAVAGIVGNVVLYGRNHPYGEPTTEETVERVTLDKVKGFYDTYYKPNVAYLAVVGDITPAEARTAVEKYFGKWQKGTVPKHTYTADPAPAKTKIALVDRASSVQSVLNITHTVPLKPGSPDAIKARITNDILGGAGGRLYNNLREKRGLTYGAYSSISPDKLIGEFSAGASVRNAVTDSALVEFMNELKRIRDAKVSPEELKQSKAGVTGSFVRSLESPQTVASFAINTARYKLPADYYQNYLKNVAAVTAEDVQNTAKKYIHPDQAHIVVVGNASEVAEKLKPFGEIEYYDVKGNKVTPGTKKAAPAGLTADQVIDKFLQTIGGREKLGQVKDLTMKMSASVQGMPLAVVQQRKAPNKAKTVMQAQGMDVFTITSDGKRAVMSQMGNQQEMTGPELEAVKIQNTLFAELYYDQMGIKRSLTGTETVEGKEAYKVELEMPGGTKITEYYDAATGLKIRVVGSQNTPEGAVTQSTDLGDYKEVNGVQYPHMVTTSIGPQQIKMQVTGIEVNQNLEDSLFEIK